MQTITYRVESELEFQRIIGSLEDHKIPYTVIKHVDTSFPVLGLTKGYADITVPKEYERQIQSLLKALQQDILPEEVPQEGDMLLTNSTISSNSKKNRIWPIVLIGYSILVSLLLFKYWNIYRRSAAEDKNFNYTWSLDNTNLFIKHKKTGKNSHTYADANYDMNYEKLRSFSREGYLVLESYDLNEDGFFEQSYYFNQNGAVTGTQIDGDNDGLTDVATIVLENKDTLRLFDADKNGFFEIRK
jgi:hypothetical protein